MSIMLSPFGFRDFKHLTFYGHLRQSFTSYNVMSMLSLSDFIILNRLCVNPKCCFNTIEFSKKCYFLREKFMSFPVRSFRVCFRKRERNCCSLTDDQWSNLKFLLYHNIWGIAHYSAFLKLVFYVNFSSMNNHEMVFNTYPR